jgi:hypothetical protein
MIEILHFKKGATIIKLNAAVPNLNAQGSLISYCGNKTMENTQLDWLSKDGIKFCFTLFLSVISLLHKHLTASE